MYVAVISGSRSIQNLPVDAISSIEKMIEDRAKILIGDAPGIDRLVQEFLVRRKYRQVTVFHAYSKPRYNLGNWELFGGYSSYTERDTAMHKAGQFGLCIWDGKSRGTKANIQRLPSKVIITQVASYRLLVGVGERAKVKG